MKRISLFVAFFALCLSLGISAYADDGLGQINVQVRAGAYPGAPDSLMTGVNILKFEIFFNNTIGQRSDVGGAFRVFGPDGKWWDSVRIAKDNAAFWAGANATATVLQPKAPVTEDTVGYIGAGNPDPAMPFPFNDSVMALTVYTTGNADAHIGKTLCLDTTTTFTGVDSRWVSADLASHFPPISTPAAGNCWKMAKVPNLKPVMAPATIPPASHCAPISYQFTATDNEHDPITFHLQAGDKGTIDPTTGVWNFVPTKADVGASITIHPYASDPIAGDGAALSVAIVVTNVDPTLACPTGVTEGVKNADACVTLTAVSGDCDVLTWTVGGGATLTPSGTKQESAQICFSSADSGSFAIPVTVSDGITTLNCTVNFHILNTSFYGVKIPKLEKVPQGQFVELPIMLTGINADPVSGGIGGFDLLIAYDNSALSLQGATAGSIYGTCKWEYFTYRFGANGNCGNGCPSGLVRLIGMAEINNGASHSIAGCPTGAQLPLSLATLKFLVTNDRNFECQYIPVRFFWVDCGDNGISNEAGTKLFVYNSLYDFDKFPQPVKIQQPSGYTLPGYVGLPAQYCNGYKTAVDYNIDFTNGGIDIVCADSIDARGDINMNGVAYEIADAVMFTNYFIYGSSALGAYPLGAAAASDVNADGLTLSVADLVYLIRVIVGDALPYAKVAPVEATYTNNGGVLNISAEMGAALVTYKGNVIPENLTGSKMGYAFDGTNTRVLIYPSTDHFTTFSGNFLRANGEVLSVEFGSATGSTVTAKLLPSAYALNQNYPNPFNPATTISFALPSAGAYNLAIYNVTGQKVAEFNGTAPAGNQSVVWNANDNASGIYFYKLTAGNFTATKKMVLVK